MAGPYQEESTPVGKTGGNATTAGGEICREGMQSCNGSAGIGAEDPAQRAGDPEQYGQVRADERVERPSGRGRVGSRVVGL
jgi:hypothetical protein